MWLQPFFTHYLHTQGVLRRDVVANELLWALEGLVEEE